MSDPVRLFTVIALVALPGNTVTVAGPGLLTVAMLIVAYGVAVY